jgi:cell division septal protein FtsQ
MRRKRNKAPGQGLPGLRGLWDLLARRTPKGGRAKPRPRAGRRPVATSGGVLQRAWGRLTFLRDRGKNRRRGQTTPPVAALGQVAPTPQPAARRGAARGARLVWLLARPLLGLLAWVTPVVVAVAAFATPLLGVRAYDYVMTTGHFHVRDVLIEGNERLDYDAILALAQIEPGTHVLSADLDVMARRLTAHPWVAHAVVTRELPNRFVIRVTEHQPVAYIALGDLWLVNSRGELFAPLEPGDDFPLPIITGVPEDFDATPARAAVTRADIRAAVNLAKLHASMGLTERWPIAEVRVSTGRRMSLVWVLENLRQQGKVADYVLLDVQAGGTEQGRVIVRADLAPSQSELRKDAAAHAQDVVKKLDGSVNSTETGRDTGKNPDLGAPSQIRPAPPGGMDGLLPRMRRQARQRGEE